MNRFLCAGLAAGIAHMCWAAPVRAQVLTPDDAVALAMEHRAELDAAAAATTAAEGAVLQAGLRPNPVFSFQSENWRAWGSPGLSVGRDLDVFATVMQPIETGGKRRARRELAESSKRLTALEREALRWQIRGQVLRAYAQAQGADARRAVLAEGLTTYQDLERYQSARFEEGAAAEVDVIKVSIERRRAEAALAEADTQVSRAMIALNAAMGSPPGREGFRLPEVRPEIAPLPADWERRKAEAIQSHPRLALLHAEVAESSASVDVQRSLAKPNVSPYLGYKRDGNFNTLVGGVSVPLTISDRNQGAIAQAMAESRRRQALVRAAEVALAAEIDGAADSWERHAAIARSVAEGAARQAKEARDIALVAYREQGVDLLFLLDTQRTERDAALLAAETLYNYQLSRLELENALGSPLDGDPR